MNPYLRGSQLTYSPDPRERQPLHAATEFMPCTVFTELTYFPGHWEASIHPYGQTYYLRRLPTLLNLRTFPDPRKRQSIHTARHTIYGVYVLYGIYVLSRTLESVTHWDGQQEKKVTFSV